MVRKHDLHSDFVNPPNFTFMKIFTSLLAFLIVGSSLFSQDGKLLEKELFVLNEKIITKIQAADSALGAGLSNLNFYKITYLSDGLKVKGVLIEPKAEGKYPCIIANRGGNRDFGKWTPVSAAYFLGQMADWGYVVIASQYRGVAGGEGTEEFGGKDLNDVLNLTKVLEQLPKADTSRIGLQGGSRGGMMTYLAMKSSCRFKAAAVIAGGADLITSVKSRPKMETGVYGQLIPNYEENKEEALKSRSAVYWADKMCATTPLLIMHGSADWRVEPAVSIKLVSKLTEFKHPVRFILYEGADHGLREYRSEMLAEMKRHFDFYLRDENPLPNMEPHGK